jgi:hypothetical protein
MEDSKNKQKLLTFFGITLFTQAVTSLIGGSIFLSPFSPKEMTAETMSAIPGDTMTIYISITLYMITSVVIIMLGVAMYRLGGYINKTLGIIALSLYIVESIMLAVGQAFIWGLLTVSQMYNISGNAYLLDLGTLFIGCKEFLGSMAMIPFGIGAVFFYYLMMKSNVFPKWLALWGLITAPLILVFVPLKTFGVDVPFAFLVPYVPFEFFAGIYILVRYRRRRALKISHD